MTCEIVSQTVGLWFYSITYSREDKYKSRHSVKKESSGYKEWQQGHQDVQDKL